MSFEKYDNIVTIRRDISDISPAIHQHGTTTHLWGTLYNCSKSHIKAQISILEKIGDFASILQFSSGPTSEWQCADTSTSPTINISVGSGEERNVLSMIDEYLSKKIVFQDIFTLWCK